MLQVLKKREGDSGLVVVVSTKSKKKKRNENMRIKCLIEKNKKQ